MSESESKSASRNPIFRLFWEGNMKTKVLAQDSQNYEISDAVPLATHHVDIGMPQSSNLKEQAVQITDASAILEVSNEHEEHVITEINSSSCTQRRKKIKKESSDDELSPNKSHLNCKIKKEINSDQSAVRKRFNRNWYSIPELSKWLEESPIPGYAFCNICKKDLLPGKSELLKHASTAKHTRKIEALGQGTKEDPTTQRIVDLRSDSVTVPNREMRDAMRNAEVGDDSFEEDPTVTELETKVARLTSKEAGLFILSGTMANTISVLTHCWNRGSLIIVGDQSYLYRASQGCLSEFGSISQRTVRNLPNGTFSLSELKDILKTYTPTWPTYTLVCIENTHTRMGGKALPLDWLNELGSLCSDYGIQIHLDGARLINASAAIGSSPSKLSYHCSSVSFGLDKGLGAPGGCVIASTKDFIDRARIIKKSLGGTIHQAGVIAAACIYGLNHFVSRISKDHSNAIAIAKGVCTSNSSAITVDKNSIQTNIIHLICDNIRVHPQQLCQRLTQVTQEEAMELTESIIVKATPIQPNIVRLMTHGDLLMEDIRAVIRKLKYVIAEYDNFFVLEYNV